MIKILGVSAFYHDSSAAIIVDGEIMCAVQEERFSRVKHTADFPVQSIQYCLEETGLTLNDMDAVVFYDKPFLKFERLLETYYRFAPKGLVSFVTSMPVWLKEKLFLKRKIIQELKGIEEVDTKKLKLLFPEHHLSHAASAYYPSGYKDAAILTIDGVGEWATCSISHGDGHQIKNIKEMHFPHSVGLLYSAFTYFLGFKVNSGEYKLMGLAPYGKETDSDFSKYVDTIKKELVKINEDGSIYLNQKMFSYATGLRMVPDKKWEKLFGFPRRESESKLEQHHCDLALAIQRVTEEIVIKLCKEAKRVTNSSNLCLAGGVALNCVANGKIHESKLFENIFIQPASGDAGGSIGSGLAAYHLYFDKPRVDLKGAMDGMKGAYLGPEYSDQEVSRMTKKYKAVYKVCTEGDLLDTVSNHVLNNKVIGWMQGRMEYGPRSLGNRSIIANPTDEQMQKKLNLKIKYRESFRPFAPVVLDSDVSQYFDFDQASPYMLMVKEVSERVKEKSLPENYQSLGMKEKLYVKRSQIPSITHVDFTARIQTVHKETNPKFWKLLKSVKEKTGLGMLINTSFNVRNEPIVNSPEDAYRCFMRTEMDVLVIGNYLFVKEEQPQWKEKDDWRDEFVMD